MSRTVIGTGFGRRTSRCRPAQLIDDIVEQWAVLDDEVRAVGGMVAFVKPHGALYNRMGPTRPSAPRWSRRCAGSSSRVLVAQSGTGVVERRHTPGPQVVAEGFPDRGYLGDGALAPRGSTPEPWSTTRRRRPTARCRWSSGAASPPWTGPGCRIAAGDPVHPRRLARRRRDGTAVRSALEAEAVTLGPFVPDSSCGRRRRWTGTVVAWDAVAMAPGSATVTAPCWSRWTTSPRPTGWPRPSTGGDTGHTPDQIERPWSDSAMSWST